MGFIILEGIDRSGKSTVAETYKKRGYEVVHMSAPDKKYTQPGYTGPSYLDDMMDLYMEYSHKDVVFDRSIYGELVWSHVYGRTPLLSAEDISVLKEIEDSANAERILMIDSDAQAHWKRCVDNNEPLTQHQFKTAKSLYSQLAHKHGFIPKTLKDFVKDVDSKVLNKNIEDVNVEKVISIKEDTNPVNGNSISDRGSNKEVNSKQSTELEKLEKANAIKTVLTNRIIKKKGEIFDKIELDLKDFLTKQLSDIFNSNQDVDNFTDEDKLILKTYCTRMKERLNEKK